MQSGRRRWGEKEGAHLQDAVGLFSLSCYICTGKNINQGCAGLYLANFSLKFLTGDPRVWLHALTAYF